MGKIKVLIIFVLFVAVFVAGVYFSKDVNKQIQDFEKTEVGQILAKAKEEILAPKPLNIGGQAKQVILLRSKIIEETNLQRQENGNLQALVENEKLDQSALAKANDMFLNQYFEHISPTGVDPGKLVQASGYDYIVAGENLILGNFSSEKEVVQDWMNSAGHRENILNSRYTEIGVAIIKGIYKGENVWMGVQEFGLPLSACENPDKALKDKIDNNKTQLDVLFSGIEFSKNQIENTEKKSPAYSQMINDYNQMVLQYNALAETTKKIVEQYNNQVSVFNQCVEGR